MKYCPNCGAEMMDDAVICVKCGKQVAPMVSATPAVRDASSPGYGILGFFIPIVGLVLYLNWKKDTPLRAKSAGIGALIGFIVNMVVYFIYYYV